VVLSTTSPTPPHHNLIKSPPRELTNFERKKGTPMKSVRFGWSASIAQLGVLLLLLLPVMSGCGPGQGKVTGRVTLGGTPVPGGSLLFRPANPKFNAVSAEINEQGNYEAVLPAGEVQVSVDNQALKPRERITGIIPPTVRSRLPAAPPPAPAVENPNAPTTPHGRYVEIPKKYYQIETSGLKFTVQGGDQTQPIELTK